MRTLRKASKYAESCDLTTQSLSTKHGKPTDKLVDCCKTQLSRVHYFFTFLFFVRYTRRKIQKCFISSVDWATFPCNW